MNEIADNIGVICEYAKNNFRNIENYEEIKRITEIVKRDFNKYINHVWLWWVENRFYGKLCQIIAKYLKIW